MGKAQEKGLFSIRTLHLREFAGNKHNKVDDTVYGGGPGMLLQLPPIYRALESLGEEKGHVILLSPAGETWNQSLAKDLVQAHRQFTFVSGYYEGIDHRVHEYLVDREVSLGNYVISTGDLGCLVLADCLLRLVPGVLGREESLSEESHNDSEFLEYPQYTKPADFLGWKVPEVLLNGHHEEIRQWRLKNLRKRT